MSLRPSAPTGKELVFLEAPPQRAGEIHLRSTHALIDRIIELDASPLTKPRAISKRVLGRCHHFALLAVAALRAHGTPACARCGFGAYFNPPNFEDHWVCEYWNGERWILADPQFDAVWVEKLKVRHDVLDVPRDQFLVAAEGWRQCRAGKLDSGRFGIEFVKLRGLWFIAGSLIRDLAAMNKVELLPWDIWGAQPQPNAELTEDQLRFFDRLAELTCEPEQRFEELRESYRADERLRVPPQVFNSLTQTLEPVDAVKGSGSRSSKPHSTAASHL